MRKRVIRAESFEREASNVAQLASVPDISNLPVCVEEVRQAAVDGDPGPPAPTDFHDLRGRLEASRLKLPPLYRDAVFTPFVSKLDALGQSGFNQVLIGDPGRVRAAGLMLDIAQAILQNGEDYEQRATDGFQEVTSDLFDGFLSAEDRRAVDPPDEGVIAPLVKWGNPDFGPYTWPVDATLNFGVAAPIVNLPPANARRGLLAWSALGHETGGHDILHADSGLLQELAENVHSGLRAAGLDDPLPDYWADRIDETASDVLGILNMGPAVGIGLIGYFRGLNAAFGVGPTLRNEGPDSDPHPADILRGFLSAACVRRLRFGGAHAWAAVIEEEALKDLSGVRINGVEISEAAARQSADVVAQVIMQGRLQSLQNHSLDYIQNWRDLDESIVQQLRRLLTVVGQLPSRIESGIYAAHVVAAAVTAGVSQGADISTLFDRMLVLLKRMHDANPSWGPLFVAHPGDIAADYAYMSYASQSA